MPAISLIGDAGDIGDVDVVDDIGESLLAYAAQPLAELFLSRTPTNVLLQGCSKGRSK